MSTYTSNLLRLVSRGTKPTFIKFLSCSTLVVFLLLASVAQDKPLATTQQYSPIAVPVLTLEEAEQANNESLNQFASGAPVATPLLTQEEAQRANKEALNDYIRKKTDKRIKYFLEKNVLDTWGNLYGKNKIIISVLFFLIPFLLLSDVILFKKTRKNSNTIIKTYLSIPRQCYILSTVTLLVFSLLVFVPWSIYFGNHTQFPFIFSDFLSENLLGITVSIIWLTAFFLVIPPFISNYLIALVSGLGLCIYFQAMFMNLHLEQMNGVEPVWEQYHQWGVYNNIIWGIIILIPVFAVVLIRCYGKKIISITNIAVLSLELIAMLSLILAAPAAVWKREKTFFPDGTTRYQLSKDKNIVVFILDALGSGYLQYCFETSPETKKELKDFIWYSDARSNYPNTIPGLCHELTGTLVYPAKNRKDMLNQAWLSPSAKSFYKQIREAGFDPRLFISKEDCSFEVGDIDLYHEYFSNFKDVDLKYEIDKEELHRCLIQISLFSSLPYFVKKYFYYDNSSYDEIATALPASGISITKDNDAFYKAMIDQGITTDSDHPVLAFQYTRGAHPKWFLNEKCENQGRTYDDPLPTIKGCIFLLSEFIRLLKENDIYDNTAILVCSDHGSLTPDYSTPFDMSFLIKPFHQNNSSIIYDESKVQSLDVLPSLLQMACGDQADYSAFEGYPVTSVPVDRKRLVYKLILHHQIPSFMEDFNTTTPHRYNCMRESSFEDVDSFINSPEKAFQKYIPLNVDAEVDASILNRY